MTTQSILLTLDLVKYTWRCSNSLAISPVVLSNYNRHTEGSMRLQTAAICDGFETVQGQGYTLIGVSGALIIEGTYRGRPGTPQPTIPINRKIVLMLLDGQNGPHQLLLTVQNSVSESPIASRPVHFEWPDDAPSHLIELDLDMGLPGAGLYDFHILIDGEPLVVIPLRIIVNVNRID